MNRVEIQEKIGRSSTLLVAEGDSWFEFPLRSHVVRELRRLGYAVREVADHSHTLQFMATSPHQKAEFVDKLRTVEKNRQRPAAIVLSGGGNDFVDILPSLLNEYHPETPALNQHAVDDFQKNHLRRYYKIWLEYITKSCLEVFGEDGLVPILIHGYAYAVPDGRGVPFVGHWLRKEFRAKGHISRAQNTKTIATLIDKFNDMICRLPEEDRFKHVHYVNLRNTLSNDLTREDGKRKYKLDWGDELHPTNEGFSKVAAEFSKTIDNLPKLTALPSTPNT